MKRIFVGVVVLLASVVIGCGNKSTKDDWTPPSVPDPKPQPSGPTVPGPKVDEKVGHVLDSMMVPVLSTESCTTDLTSKWFKTYTAATWDDLNKVTLRIYKNGAYELVVDVDRYQNGAVSHLYRQKYSGWTEHFGGIMLKSDGENYARLSAVRVAPSAQYALRFDKKDEFNRDFSSAIFLSPNKMCGGMEQAR